MTLPGQAVALALQQQTPAGVGATVCLLLKNKQPKKSPQTKPQPTTTSSSSLPVTARFVQRDPMKDEHTMLCSSSLSSRMARRHAQVLKKHSLLCQQLFERGKCRGFAEDWLRGTGGWLWVRARDAPQAPDTLTWGSHRASLG